MGTSFSGLSKSADRPLNKTVSDKNLQYLASYNNKLSHPICCLLLIDKARAKDKPIFYCYSDVDVRLFYYESMKRAKDKTYI